MAELPKIVEFLSLPEAYPDAPTSVERIETHISWVFLTDQFAYKLKKQVAFDFLDFSTRELRRAACEEEVRLNRRLAASVYLDVVPITESPMGELTLGGLGHSVDYVVKMVRLPDDRSLDRLIAAGRVSEHDLEKLAARLAAFYRELPRLHIQAGDYRRQIETHVRANRHALLEVANAASASLAKRLHGAQLQFLLLSPGVFDERVRAGCVVEGHGDLRPEHVYFLPEPVALDCIEFNAEYRRIDVLDELGFLAMECDRLGAADVGNTLLCRCAEILEDAFPPKLLAFYKSYRACVRAKVAGLHGAQHTGLERERALAEREAYLNLADREAAPLLRPLVVIVRGLSGTGKSTVAAALADAFGAEWLSTDAIRNDLFSTALSGTSGSKDKYAPENRAAAYEELFRRAETFLNDGISVVLDGTFLTADLCRRAAALSNSHGASFLIVDCRCPDDLARQRIAARLLAGNSASEAFPELHAIQQHELEPPAADLACCALDTSRTIDTLIPDLLGSLRQVYE